MSEINVTPFVDVMLVLLIVFMVTAPLLTVGIPVDLPKVKASALTDQKDPIEITVKLDGTVYLGESEVEVENLIPRLNAITDQNTERSINREKSYNKTVLNISEIELKKHREFLKSEIKKNFY